MKRILLTTICILALTGCAAPKDDPEAAERERRAQAMLDEIDADAEKLREREDAFLAEAGIGAERIVLKLADTNRTFDVAMRAADSFILELEENGTTGFLWSADFDPDFASVVITHHAPPMDNDMVGQAGYCLVEITALQPGATTVTLKYSRSFEPDNEPPHKLIYNLKISN